MERAGLFREIQECEGGDSGRSHNAHPSAGLHAGIWRAEKVQDHCMTYFRTIGESKDAVGVFVSDVGKVSSRRAVSVIKGVIAIGMFIAACAVLLGFEQYRTQLEIGAVISGYVSDELFYPGHLPTDSAGVPILVQVFRGKPDIGSLSRVFDRGLCFRDLSLMTCASFVVSNVSSSRRHNTANSRLAVTYMTARPDNRSRTDAPDVDEHGAYITVSDVGLNWSKTEAIFYAKQIVAPSLGGFVIMRKIGDSWHVVPRVRQFASAESSDGRE